MSKMPQITRKRKKSKKMGEPEIVSREDVEAMDVDSRLELIRSLIPLGLMAVYEELDREVDALAGARHSRKDDGSRYYRHGANRGSVKLAGQRVPIKVARVRSLQSGAKDFLTKPFDRIETLTRIHNMLEVRLLHNQVRDQNVILERKVQERTAELNDTRLEIIRRLGIAAEYRDNETGLHIIRMSKICQVLGKAVGMTESEAELLLNASPMHDIGKIGIPDRILLKPGKLDADEWEIMKTHAAIGADMLSGHSSELLNMAKEIALTHHEKWDGSGYPRGLKGEDNPLAGRICAVSDVFDALTSVRPYKKAWSVEDSVAEIQRGKGANFDPDMVDVFMDTLDEIVSIKEQYKGPEE